MYRLERPLAIANNGMRNAHEGLDVTHVETLQVIQQSISATHLPTLIDKPPEMLSLSPPRDTYGRWRSRPTSH